MVERFAVIAISSGRVRSGDVAVSSVLNDRVPVLSHVSLTGLALRLVFDLEGGGSGEGLESDSRVTTGDVLVVSMVLGKGLLE